MKEVKMGEWGKNIDLGGVAAEELDSADAVGVEAVVDVAGEVVANDRGRKCDPRSPFGHQFFNTCETFDPRVIEVLAHLQSRDSGRGERFGSNRPDRRDPG